MFGFFVGDIIGSAYAHENEIFNKKTKDFELFSNRSKFTDDTILTFATMKWLMGGDHSSESMINSIKAFYHDFPDTNPTIYGENFVKWVCAGCSEFRPSTGNGGAMRCTPIGWYASELREIDKLINSGISPTHNTERAKTAAQIVCYAIFWLKSGKSRSYVRHNISKKFKIDLPIDYESYRTNYTFTSDAIDTVIPALLAFFTSNSFMDAIKNAVSFGGDTDTITTICASVSEAYYRKIPDEVLLRAKSFLPANLTYLLDEFNHFLEKKGINFKNTIKKM